MFIGVTFALTAGIMWGLVFVGPLLLPEYPVALLVFGRYLAFGIIAILVAWIDRVELSKLTRTDWVEAVKLTSIGNLLYYMFLASAIQRAGGPLPTMVIGTLPVVISICANFFNRHRDGLLPWRYLAPCLITILVGIACVNHAEMAFFSNASRADFWHYTSGAVLAGLAVACWTWYPLRNAHWLRNHSDYKPRTWATAQGLVTLPIAFIGYGIFWGWSNLTDNAFNMPFGPRPLAFVGIMFAIGLFASWLGTHCWNEASRRLSAALMGQMIVFETIAALSYAYLLRGHLPTPLTLFGIALLLTGVLLATRIKPLHVKTAMTLRGT